MKMGMSESNVIMIQKTALEKLRDYYVSVYGDDEALKVLKIG